MKRKWLFCDFVLEAKTYNSPEDVCKALDITSIGHPEMTCRDKVVFGNPKKLEVKSIQENVPEAEEPKPQSLLSDEPQTEEPSGDEES